MEPNYRNSYYTLKESIEKAFEKDDHASIRNCYQQLLEEDITYMPEVVYVEYLKLLERARELLGIN